MMKYTVATVAQDCQNIFNIRKYIYISLSTARFLTDGISVTAHHEFSDEFAAKFAGLSTEFTNVPRVITMDVNIQEKIRQKYKLQSVSNFASEWVHE